MPIRIKTDLDWGMIFYLKNDVDQLPHLLIGIIVTPPNQFKFRLSHLGEICEVYDFEVSSEINTSIMRKDE